MATDLQRIKLSEFKEQARSGSAPERALLPKQYACDEVAQMGGDDDRTLRFTISTGSVDRDDDTVNPQGWELDNFRKGGVVLWAHDSRLPPIANPVDAWIEGSRLKSLAKFTPPDMSHPLGDGFGATIFRMFKEGYMKSTSVGFIPLEWSWSNERGGAAIDFERQELLEYSPVPVPANPEALVELGKKGIDLRPIHQWAEHCLDGEGTLIVPRRLVEEAHKSFGKAIGKSTAIIVDLQAACGVKKGEALAGLLNRSIEEMVTEERTRADVVDQMAEAAGISAGTVNQILNGTINCPPLERLQGFARVLDVSLEEMTAAGDRDGCEYQRSAESATKRPITWASAHPDGTPADDREEDWDGPREIAAADVEDLAVMATWVDEENPDVKGSYKLPHHRAEGRHNVVWRGVTASMGVLLGARGGVDVPDADRQGIYNHLARHYRDDFEAEPPELRAYSETELKSMFPELYPKIGPTYAEAMEIAEKAQAELLDLIVRGLTELKRGRVISAANEQRLRDAAQLILDVLQQLEPAEGDDGKGVNDQSTVDLSQDDLKEIASLVKDEVGAQMARMTGRLQ